MNDIGQERRGSVLTNTGFGSYGPGLAFSNQTQSTQARSILNSALNGQENNRVMSPGSSISAGMSRWISVLNLILMKLAPGMSTTRSPQGPNGVSAQDKEVGISHFCVLVTDELIRYRMASVLRTFQSTKAVRCNSVNHNLVACQRTTKIQRVQAKAPTNRLFLK